MLEKVPKTGVEMSNAQLNAIRLLLRGTIVILLVFSVTFYLAAVVPFFGALLGLIATVAMIPIAIVILRATE